MQQLRVQINTWDRKEETKHDSNYTKWATNSLNFSETIAEIKRTDPEIIKHFNAQHNWAQNLSCSLHVKMPTNFGI